MKLTFRKIMVIVGIFLLGFTAFSCNSGSNDPGSDIPDSEVSGSEETDSDSEADSDSEHIHTFSEDWTTDETDHWHTATCGHTDEVDSKAAHTFKDNVCTVCGYDRALGTSPVKITDGKNTYDEPQD